MEQYTIPQLRKMMRNARRRKYESHLYVKLGNDESIVGKLTECAPGYGSPGFQLKGDTTKEWYALGGAEWTFSVH